MNVHANVFANPPTNRRRATLLVILLASPGFHCLPQERQVTTIFPLPNKIDHHPKSRNPSKLNRRCVAWTLLELQYGHIAILPLG